LADGVPLENHSRVFVLRHGATEWSVTGRHTGRTDLPLSPEGEDEARQLGALLGGRPFAAVLVSPLARAQETCRLAGYAGVAETTDDLLEWDYGDYEGLTIAQSRETVPGWTVWTGGCPGGETIAEVAARADRVIARARAVDGDVALFAHGHILRVLTARWCDLDPTQGRCFALDTAKLSTLGWEHEYPTIHTWNASA
jgi:broad specificity phosphatase PhoE